MKKAKANCDLNSCMFCRSCVKEWLPAIDVNRSTYHIKKGETVFHEGDKVTAMYFVVEGAVKVHKKWGDKELIIRFAKEGSIFGHRGLCKDSIYPISGTAIEASTICMIDIDFFISSVKVNHQFLFEFMLFFAEDLKLSEEKMRNMAHMPVKGRIATALLTLSEKFGTTSDGFIDLNISRQDIASYAGTTYETLFRVMNELVEANFVATSEKNITIINSEALSRIAIDGKG